MPRQLLHWLSGDAVIFAPASHRKLSGRSVNKRLPCGQQIAVVLAAGDRQTSVFLQQKSEGETVGCKACS